MLWACIAAGGKGHVTLVERRMDSVKYQGILKGQLQSVEKKQNKR